MTSQMGEDDEREPLGVPDTSTTETSVLAVTDLSNLTGDDDVDDVVTLEIVNPLLAAAAMEIDR